MDPMAGRQLGLCCGTPPRDNDLSAPLLSSRQVVNERGGSLRTPHSITIVDAAHFVAGDDVLKDDRATTASPDNSEGSPSDLPPTGEKRQNSVLLPPNGDEKDKKQQKALFFGLCLARLSCSWLAKVTIIILLLVALFYEGPMSKPIWLPVSMDKACQRCDDADKPTLLNSGASSSNLTGCQNLCREDHNCQAVDWFNKTSWCNMWSKACIKPTANWDGASSWQMAVTCVLHNGTMGLVVGGTCMTKGMELPTLGTTVRQALRERLASPESWLFTIAVVFLYLYFSLPWFREKLSPCMRPISMPLLKCWSWFKKGGIFTKTAFFIPFLLLWTIQTYRYWGLPPRSVAAAKETPLKEQLWFICSGVVALIITCRPCRGCFLGAITVVGSFLMSVCISLATCLLAPCLDVAALSAAGAAALAAPGAMIADFFSGAAVVETVAAADVVGVHEAVAVGETAFTGEAAAIADAAAAGEAATEAAVATEVAVAAESAAAAEAAAAAATVIGGVAAVAACTIL